MGTLVWLVITTVVGGFFGYLAGNPWMGAGIGFMVGLCARLGIIGDMDFDDFDFPDLSD